MAPPPQDKRKALRIQPYVAPCVVFEGERRLPGYLTDLGPRGARVVCDEVPPANGAQVILEVRFRRFVQRHHLPGEVKWSGPGGGQAGLHAFGVTFQGMAPDAQGAIEAVVEEFRRRVAQLESTTSRRHAWTEGPGPAGDAWLSLSDDELLYRIEALGPEETEDRLLMQIVRSDRHFFIRQEAAKRIRDADLLKEHVADRHIGQILVRAMTRGEDAAYLERLVLETRHLEVKKAAEAQLRLLGQVKD